jgi:hypothetical protein
MKDVFLVHITLPDVFSRNFYALIQKQKNHINDLLEKQIIVSYSLDMERKNLDLYFSRQRKRGDGHLKSVSNY